MRTTLNIDDELLKQAQKYSKIKEKTAVVNEGLRILIQKAVAQRLIELGGTEKKSRPIPRRRPPRFVNGSR